MPLKSGMQLHIHHGGLLTVTVSLPHLGHFQKIVRLGHGMKELTAESPFPSSSESGSADTFQVYLLKRLDKVCPAEKVSEKTADSADAGKKFRLTPTRIQKVREKTGLTKPQFAKLLGVNYISLVNWESGKTKPRMEQLQKIAEVRGYGKRELKAAMDGKGIAVKAVKAVKAAKTVKKAVPPAKPAEEKVQEKSEK